MHKLTYSPMKLGQTVIACNIKHGDAGVTLGSFCERRCLRDFWRVICLHLIIQTARKTVALLGHEGPRLADFQAVQQEDVSFTEVMLCHIKAETSGS